MLRLVYQRSTHPFSLKGPQGREKGERYTNLNIGSPLFHEPLLSCSLYQKNCKEKGKKKNH